MIVFARALRIAALCFLVALVSPAIAQQVLSRPNVGLAAGGFVVALARQPNGATIVAGQFVTLGGLPRAGLARLRPDGTPDPAWAPTFTGSQGIAALAVDASGNVYAGGAFGVVKISAAGTVDATFQGSSTGDVELIALDGNGHLYVAGGGLRQIGGRPAAGVARLNVQTGASDANWTLPAPVDRRIRAIAADADALYVGGYFDAIGGQMRHNIAKLTSTGSVDATWNPGADSIVWALAVGGASLYVGGDFSTVGGQSIPGLARVSRTGAGNADASWLPGISDGSVDQLAFDGAGRVYASRSIWSPDTTLYEVRRYSVATAAMDPTWVPDPNREVYALVADGTSVAIGGLFNRVSQQPRSGLAAFAAGGALRPATNPERLARVWAVARQPDGGTIIGGDFNRADGFERRYLARLTAAGAVDPNWDPSPNNPVLALEVDSTGSVYAGGQFDTVGGLPRLRAAKISNGGIVDPNWNPSLDYEVRAIERDADGSVYLGGMFTRVGGVARMGVARLRPDGTLDPAWNPGTDAMVYALALDGHGALFIGGDFGHAGGLERRNLAKLRTSDSSVDAAWNVPVIGFVTALAVGANDALYAGGYFATIAGAPRESLARIGANGSLDAWNPLNDGNAAITSSYVRAITLDAAGNVYAGGGLMLAPARFAQSARFSASTGVVDESWVVSGDNDVTALATGVGDTMIAGGIFTTIGGVRRNGLAVLATSDVIFADGFEPD